MRGVACTITTTTPRAHTLRNRSLHAHTHNGVTLPSWHSHSRLVCCITSPGLLYHFTVEYWVTVWIYGWRILLKGHASVRCFSLYSVYFLQSPSSIWSCDYMCVHPCRGCWKTSKTKRNPTPVGFKQQTEGAWVWPCERRTLLSGKCCGWFQLLMSLFAYPASHVEEGGFEPMYLELFPPSCR